MTDQLLEENSPRVLYDIRKDASLLEKMRNASMSKGPWGVAIHHGFVGSPEWWSAVESRQIKLEAFVGIVSADFGAHGDTLHVHITSPEGKQNWTGWNGFDFALVGRRIRTCYVRLEPKDPSINRPGYLVPVLLQVEAMD